MENADNNSTLIKKIRIIIKEIFLAPTIPGGKFNINPEIEQNPIDFSSRVAKYLNNPMKLDSSMINDLFQLPNTTHYIEYAFKKGIPISSTAQHLYDTQLKANEIKLTPNGEDIDIEFPSVDDIWV